MNASKGRARDGGCGTSKARVEERSHDDSVRHHSANVNAGHCPTCTCEPAYPAPDGGYDTCNGRHAPARLYWNGQVWRCPVADAEWERLKAEAAEAREQRRQQRREAKATVATAKVGE